MRTWGAETVGMALLFALALNAAPLWRAVAHDPVLAWIQLPLFVLLAGVVYAAAVRWSWPRLTQGVVSIRGVSKTVPMNQSCHSVARGPKVSSVHTEDGWLLGQHPHTAARQLAAAVESGTNCRTRPQLGSGFWSGVLVLVGGLVGLLLTTPAVAGVAGLALLGWVVYATSHDWWGAETVEHWEGPDDTQWWRVQSAKPPLTARKHVGALVGQTRILFAGPAMWLVMLGIMPLWRGSFLLMSVALLGVTSIFAIWWLRFVPVHGYGLDPQDATTTSTGRTWRQAMGAQADLGTVTTVPYDDAAAVVWARREWGLFVAFALTGLSAIGALGLLTWAGSETVGLIRIVLAPLVVGVGYATARWLLDRSCRDEAVLAVLGRHGQLLLGKQAADFALEDATFTVQRHKVVMSLRDGRVFHLDALEPERLAAVLREHQGTPVPLTATQEADAQSLGRLLECV